MTVLDDVNALFPDNDTGQIDASHLREAFEIVYEWAMVTEARVTALELAGGQIGYGGVWQYNPTAGAVPQTMQIAFDVGTLASATLIRIWPTDRNNIDLSNFITTATYVYVQQSTDASNHGYYQVTGATTFQDGYYQLEVTYVNGNGDATAAQWQEVVVVFTMPSA